MIQIDANTARAIGFLLLTGFLVWRLIKSNPGDKFIQYGSLAAMLCLVAAVLHRIFPNFPIDDYAPFFAITILLLFVLAMFLPVPAAIPRAQTKEAGAAQ